jgi:hypothetical protein
MLLRIIKVLGRARGRLGRRPWFFHLPVTPLHPFLK